MTSEEGVEALAKLGLIGSAETVEQLPSEDEKLVIEVSRADLLRARARILREMPTGLREALRNIDHLLGWPPKGSS